MKRFPMFLDWLNHNDHPAEAQSPIRAAAVAALVSFIFIYWLDSRAMSSFRAGWAELLVYAFVPILLAFIILYRSSWHREMANSTRSFWAALVSCVIFGGVLLSIVAAMILLAVVYYSHFANFMGFHY
jgi:hypothetical protein